MSKSRKTAARQTLVPANVLAYEKGFWERRLYCDLHGVVLKWKEAFAEFASDALGRNIDPDSFQYYYPQFQKGTHISPAEFDELFLQFAALGVGGYGDLQAYDGVVDQMHLISKAGINIKIASWCPGASDISFAHSQAYMSGAAQGTTAALIKRLGLPVDLREMEFMSPGHKHFKMMEDHCPLIVEDCPSTAAAVSSVGAGCILMPERYTEGFVMPGVTCLTDRNKLAETVIRFFDVCEEAGVLND